LLTYWTVFVHVNDLGKLVWIFGNKQIALSTSWTFISEGTPEVAVFHGAKVSFYCALFKFA